MHRKAQHVSISTVENAVGECHGARSVLRTGTTDLHVRAEELLGEKPFRDLPSYAGMLQANLSVTEAVWQAASPLLPQALTRGMAADIMRLRADLADLSAPVPHDGVGLDLRDPASALGAVYVIEGARLGGKVLARKIGASLGVSASRGATYLNGEGKAAGSRWRDFLIALEERIVSQEDIARAVMAARDTFRLVILQYERL